MVKIQSILRQTERDPKDYTPYNIWEQIVAWMDLSLFQDKQKERWEKNAEIKTREENKPTPEK